MFDKAHGKESFIDRQKLPNTFSDWVLNVAEALWNLPSFENVFKWKSSGLNTILATQPLGMEGEAERASSMAANKKHVYLQEWKLCISLLCLLRHFVIPPICWHVDFYNYMYTNVNGKPVACFFQVFGAEGTKLKSTLLVKTTDPQKKGKRLTWNLAAINTWNLGPLPQC